MPRELNNNPKTQPTLAKTGNIYRKLWAIQNEVKRIVRSEENKFQKYYFFNELQVLKLLKPLLEKYRVAIFLTDDSAEPFFCEQKGNNFVVKYLKKLDIIDIDAEEGKKKADEPENLTAEGKKNGQLTYSFWAIGANQDPAKAKGAAETYAVKYMLTKFFLIPVKNINDPDYEIRGGEKFSETKAINATDQAAQDQQVAEGFLEKHGWPEPKK